MYCIPQGANRFVNDLEDYKNFLFAFIRFIQEQLALMIQSKTE